MKKKWSVIAVVFLVFLLLCGFDENQQKVYDDGGLLAQEEIADLEQLCVEAAQELELDLVIVTTTDAKGKDAQSYADDYYDNGNFGYEGVHGSGALFLIDMDNRRIQLSTAGDAIIRITDEEVERILDAVYDDVVEEEYYDAGRHFVQSITEYASNSQVALNKQGVYNPDTKHYELEEVTPPEPGFWEKALRPEAILGHLLVAVILGAVVTVIFVFQRKTKVTVSARNYQSGAVHMNQNTDRFLHTTVIKHRIEKPRSSGGGGGGGHSFSSSHTSSGGHSHGGGGRSF